MFPLGKLLGILAVKRSFDTTLFQQLLVGAALLVMLTVVAALMLAILITGGLYGTYIALQSYGLTKDAACIMVGSLAVLLTVVIILLMRVQLTKIHAMIRKLFNQQSPITSRITDVAEAFITGLMEPAKPQNPFARSQPKANPTPQRKKV